MMARNVGKMCAGRMGDTMSSGRWDEGCRREEAVRELLSRNPDGLAQLASSLAHHVFCPQISIERGRGAGAANTGDGAPSLAS
jgi:hypothetical protein